MNVAGLFCFALYSGQLVILLFDVNDYLLLDVFYANRGVRILDKKASDYALDEEILYGQEMFERILTRTE